MPSREPTLKEEHSTWVALLHLDHMRAKTKYVKIIEKFTSQLGLTGRLFLGKVILILLQGPRENIKVNKNFECFEILFCELSYTCTCCINLMHVVNNHVLLLLMCYIWKCRGYIIFWFPLQEYIHLQKTTKVDIDSSGKKCKEKMMTVLCESPLSDGLQQ